MASYLLKLPSDHSTNSKANRIEPQDFSKFFNQQISKYLSKNGKGSALDHLDELQFLFEELKNRHKLANESFNFDQKLLKTTLQTFEIQPWMFTDIAGFWIIKDSGVPVFSLNWSKGLDPYQLSGFLSAISNFADTLGHELQEIILEGIRFLFFKEPEIGLIFSMAAPSASMPTSQGIDLLSEVCKEFKSRYIDRFIQPISIIREENFEEFSDYLIDIVIQMELEYYIKTGVLRVENPLIMQLGELFNCSSIDWKVLYFLELNSDEIFSLNKIAKNVKMPITNISESIVNLKKLNVIKEFNDGKTKKYTSNIHSKLIETVTDNHTLYQAEIIKEKIIEIAEKHISVSKEI